MQVLRTRSITLATLIGVNDTFALFKFVYLVLIKSYDSVFFFMKNSIWVISTKPLTAHAHKYFVPRFNFSKKVTNSFCTENMKYIR